VGSESTGDSDGGIDGGESEGPLDGVGRRK
jgi:hypothetical protein